MGERSGSAPTFAAHGHHYAFVEVTDLEPGTATRYDVLVDGEHVWPPPDSPFPPSVIPTLEPGKPLRLAFGSCRVSVSHDEAGHAEHGIDALRAYALQMAGLTDGVGRQRWPDLLLFLGDQVYADETSDEMREYIQARRDPSESPGWELKDYEEYAHLYRIAWSDPANRWLLSTLPTAMIFDDHDIRDDWNTSARWRQKMESTDWWHDRVVGGLASYWVYQHLGNLAPDERAQDPLWKHVTAYDGPGELDLTEPLDELAARADREPDCYRWSFSRHFDTQARLVVVDSRAARVLDPERRNILDDLEMEWLDERLTGDVDHLLIGTSLPYLLLPGLHHLEAFSEGIAAGRWGQAVARVAEEVRRLVDLEHWAAFNEGFRRVGRSVVDVARGQRGRAPSTITFLSGDVHHSYVALAWPSENGTATESAIVQAVCSPIRNPLPAVLRRTFALAAKGAAHPTGKFLGRAIPPSPLHWKLVKGPWFDNNLAVLELDGPELEMRWWRGHVVDGDVANPRLDEVASYRVTPAESDGAGKAGYARDARLTGRRRLLSGRRS